MAPAAGFEPATKWLTATYSTAELCRSAYPIIWNKRNILHLLAFSSPVFYFFPPFFSEKLLNPEKNIFSLEKSIIFLKNYLTSFKCMIYLNVKVK